MRDDTDDVADLLANLVDKSMVQLVDLEEPRYRMLETLREFGLERLAQRRERADLRARHLAWYVRRGASEAAAGLGGPRRGRVRRPSSTATSTTVARHTPARC